MAKAAAAKKKPQRRVPKTKAKEPKQKPAAQPTQEEIAFRAYHIYLERGGVEGNPDDDWLQAERDLTKGSD
jgi:hypothetical protein